MISNICPLGLSDDELSRWHDDDLSPERLALIRAHIATCAACRERLAAFEEIGVGLRNLTPPPFDLARLMATLRESSATAPLAPEPTSLPTARIPRRSRRLVTGAAGLAAVLVISLLAGYIFATHGRPLPTNHKQATPTLVPGSQTQLTAIGMSSATDGWAMGQTYTDGSVDTDPAYVLRYLNGHWTPVKTAIVGRIATIKLFSATDGWAIGDRIYHYDGTTWRQVRLPGNLGGYFSSFAAISPTDMWAASEESGENRAYIVHYDGHSWTRQSTPVLGDFFAVYGLSMVSATEGWAVGETMVNGDKGYYPPTGAILHYTAGVWRLAKTLPNYALRAISMASATDGWVGGALVTLSQTGPMPPGQSPEETDQPKLWRYMGGQWVEAPAPTIPGVQLTGQITGITMVSATDGWLFAGLDNQEVYSQPLYQKTRLGPSMFRLEQGRWVAVQTIDIQQRRYANLGQPAFLSPDEFWAVGSCIWWTGIPTGSGFGYTPTVTPLIVHYHNGTWDIVAS